MRVFMIGGSGFVGRLCRRRLADRSQWEVTVLTRRLDRHPQPDPTGAVWIEGDAAREGEWQDRMRDHDAVVNLSGASIFSLWTRRRKQELVRSRLHPTRSIAEALIRSPGRVRSLLNASAVGFYGHRGEEVLTEESRAGEGFLADLTRKWEEEAYAARFADVRVVTCRFGIILSPEGGALAKMLPVFRWGGGARLGDGGQWVSWIHSSDLVSSLLFLIETPGLEGPVNCTAPVPVTNTELTRELLCVLQRRSVLKGIPTIVLKSLLGESADVLLSSQRVIPQKLKDRRFEFAFPSLSRSLRDLLTGAG